MWSFIKNQTAKKVNGEEELNMQDKISSYSEIKHISNGKCFIKSYFDERKLEKIMELIWKGIRFILATTCSFNVIMV